MRTISRYFYRMPVIVMYITGLPLFYFLFVLSYKPFLMDEFLAVGAGRYTLNLIVSTLIVLGVVTLSRLLLFALRKRMDLNWPLYILWCLGEAVVSGLFMSIPMGIGWAAVRPYFTVMSLCVLYMAGILVFPHAILAMAVQLYQLGREVGRPIIPEEKTLIRFYDDQKRLKLVVSSEAVLYIEAEENYVHVVHLDNGKIRDFELRCSMRSLEDVLKRHGLVRCHRSYFLNAAHVDLLKKDANGYALAQLDQEGAREIPVSKRYYQTVTALL